MILPILDQPQPAAPLADSHGRTIGYLRLSLTKSCPMRCVYCRPARLADPMDQTLLSVSEMARMVSHLADRHGLRKIRLTGGEPTARPDLPAIIQALAAVAGVDDLTMTTNGLTLARRAGQYASAGLKRVNVSLDSLDPEGFARITGMNQLRRVIAGIDAAIARGMGVKLNTVVVRGANDHQLPALVEFACGRGVEIRFIELMPMGPLADQWSRRFVGEGEMRRKLEGIAADWRPLAQGAASARRYEARLDGGRRAVVGFITPMSCDFCDRCNRLRIAADGQWFPCLMDQPAAQSLLPAIRPRFDAAMFDRILRSGLGGKAARHPAAGPKIMTHIGG